MIGKYCEFCKDECIRKVWDLPKKKSIFSAYSSHSPDSTNNINEAINELNNDSTISLTWETWEEDLDIENDLIFCEICTHIVQSKAVLVDLSDFNFNVIFEYGYCIGLNNKVFPIVGPNFNFEHVNRYFRPLMGIGLSQYYDGQLAKKIKKKKFWEKENSKKIYSFTHNDILTGKLTPKITVTNFLYIKSTSPEVNEYFEQEFIDFKINTIVDSTSDSNNISWFSKQIKSSFGVIIDLGDSDPRNNLKHYSKCALVAGMATATGRRVLIVSSAKAEKPSDIVSIIKEYSSPKEAKELLKNYLNQNINSIDIVKSHSSIDYNDDKESKYVDLGEHVAENDKSFLDTCFYNHYKYSELKKADSGYRIIIGRKGTGKSAFFYRLSKDLNNENYICVNESFDKYDLNEIYELSLQLAENEADKLIMAYWQLIILASIIYSIDDYLEKGSHFRSSEADQITEFRKKLYKLPFFKQRESLYIVISHYISELKSSYADVKDIQQVLYKDSIVLMRSAVIEFLDNFDVKLFLNYDGLDSNLNLTNESRIISKILYNLNESCIKLFSKSSFRATLNLFIRTDLFNSMQERIAEKDKLRKVVIKWERDDLLKLANSRVRQSGVEHISYLLDDSFNIKRLESKLKEYIFPRPRDYIYILNTMMQISYSERKEKITADIFSKALIDYAIYVNDSLEAEFMSLPFKEFSFGRFITQVKSINNDSSKISLQWLFNIFKSLNVDEVSYKEFLSFLLETEFLHFIDNGRILQWSHVMHPQIRIENIYNGRHDRTYFSFHPAIQFLISKLT